MEALHEEICFNTLHFFDVMGRFTAAPALRIPAGYSARPCQRRRQAGPREDHRHRLILPSVVVEYVSGRAGARASEARRRDRGRSAQTLAAAVRRPGVERLDLRVKVDTDKDEREDLVKRTDETRVDRTMLSAEQVAAVVGNLKRLRDAGLYRDALAYHDLGSVRITAAWEHESKPGSDVVAMLEPNGVPSPFPDINGLSRRRETGDDRPMGNADPAAQGQ
jgi:hypothetical protein